MKNQILEGTVGIYALIGKGRIVIRETENMLRRMGIRDKVILVASGADEGAGLTFLTPYSAMTMAEYFRDRGKNVLLVLDDLSIHAKAYREISLLGRRFPGRNAYPGDIFYTHARLMERAGNFATSQGEAAITCLPIVEAPLGDITVYIQTNTMAMTDGHIFFDHILFAEGRRPAIDPFLSVTRVGRQTQSSLGREVARILLAFLKEVQAYHNFASFGAELGEHIRSALAKEEQILQLFDETPHDTIPHYLQLLIFGIIWSGLWREKVKADTRGAIDSLILRYESEELIRRAIDTFIGGCGTLEELLTRVKDFDIARNT
jgi:F-type H+-transporting ATPase subunit alpha